MNKCKILKGDTVIIVTGKDKGKVGTVINVYPKEGKIKVSGVMVAKKHQKPSKQNNGGIISIEQKIDISNVAFYDSSSKSKSKIGYKFLTDGNKVRYAKKSGEVIQNNVKTSKG